MIFVKDNAIGSEPSVVHSTEAAPFNSMWRQKPNNRRQLGGEKKPQATEALQHRINERYITYVLSRIRKFVKI